MNYTTIGLLFFGIAASAGAQTNDNLKTKNSNQIGLILSNYSYAESSLNVKMDATNLGLEYLGTVALKNDWYVLGAFDYNNGSVNYSGTGTITNIPQYYYNFKAAVGYDFAFDGFVLSPYIGLGQRYLGQKMGGMTSSTGALGYDRQSTYNYVPIGVIHRYGVAEKAKIETTFEYDHLLSGNQFSGLSALNGIGGLSGLPDINNKQTTGYGVNVAVMYKKDDWSFGPYVKYWSISQSETASGTFTSNGIAYRATVYEPANTTNEYGVKFVYLY